MGRSFLALGGAENRRKARRPAPNPARRGAAHAAMPAAGVEAIADAQRVMEPVLSAGPRRLLSAREMLTGDPPLRDFLRFRGIANVVDHENVADVAFGF